MKERKIIIKGKCKFLNEWVSLERETFEKKMAVSKEICEFTIEKCLRAEVCKETKCKFKDMEKGKEFPITEYADKLFV